MLFSCSVLSDLVTLWTAAHQALPRVIGWTDDASGGLGTTPKCHKRVRLQILQKHLLFIKEKQHMTSHFIWRNLPFESAGNSSLRESIGR